MKKFILSLGIVALFAGGYLHVQAQTQPFCQNGSCTYTSLEPLPGLPDCYGPNPNPAVCKNPGSSFAELVSKSFQLLLGIGATIAVVMLIIGALTYMFSDVVSNKTKAIARIRGAMWAIVLLVSSYLILNTINPDLVTFKLNLSVLTSGNSGGVSLTPQQAQEAATNAQIQQCQNQTNTTQVCTIQNSKCECFPNL